MFCNRRCNGCKHEIECFPEETKEDEKNVPKIKIEIPKYKSGDKPYNVFEQKRSKQVSRTESVRTFRSN